VVDRIAAGEVVERPASVVKELVENALDAGATRVRVEIEDGGRALVRVVDDGGGIPADELPLAFAQHATSKVRDDAELESVATMGFRGEALASIGAVSRARIVSRHGDDAAHELLDEGGRLGEVRPASGNRGTSVEIRDLFFNTPARRKFLRSAQGESAQVTETLTRLALPRPDVAFTYVRDGKPVWEWPAVDDPRERLRRAWPREVDERALPIEVVDGDWSLTGVAALPERAAATARFQHLYVNGRPVRDRSLQHALREAYRGLTEPGRHPAAVLMLRLPPGAVDVNVHPTKSEVRFRDAGRAWHLIHAGVREALLASDLAPVARPTPVEPVEPRSDVRETLADFFKQQLSTSQQRIEPVPQPEPTVARAEPEPEPEPEPRAGVHAIQLHNSYLAVETEEGMEIIDQHALHERVMFEELLARVRRGPLESQRLLVPATAEADERQLAALETLGPVLVRLGIEAQPLGRDVLAVHAFPTLLGDRGVRDPAAFVAEVLAKAAEADRPGDDESILHEVLDLMACKAAVKAGDKLTPGEIETLVAHKHLVARGSNCPHGRPTTLKLSLSDLERQFKRRGF
jgi:DNA mismatch repair protein MutL